MSTAPYYSGSSRYPEDMSLDYSYTYSSGGVDSSAKHYSPASTSSQSLSSDLPDLYHDYDLGTPPSTTSSDLLYTPPQEWHPTSNPAARASPTATAQSSSPLPWHSAIAGPGSIYGVQNESDYNRPSGTGRIPGEIHGQDDIDEDDGHQKHKATLYPHNLLLTQPLTRLASNTVAPAALQLNPPTSANPSLYSQAPLELHQPRPSRRISIVNLDQLASTCEYNRPNQRVGRPPENALPSLDLTNPRSRPFQWPTQFPSQLSRPHVTQLVYSNTHQPNYPSQTFQQSQMLLCCCGCLESYAFPA